MKLTQLLPLALLALTSAHTLTANAGPIRFQDDFSQAGNWASQSTATHTVTVEGGKLRVANTAFRDYTAFRQPVSVGPAATWKASVDYRFEKFNPNDKTRKASLALFSPTGAQSLYVDVTPEGLVAVFLWAGQWSQPMRWIQAASVRPGETNTLSVEREAGYFNISLNNTFVGRTAIVDFTPRGLGVLTQLNDPGIVEFDNLRLEETGIDSRYARLLGLQATPGARVFLKDDFTRTAGKPESWWTGADENKSAKVESGRYVVTGLKDSTNHMATTPVDASARGILGTYPGFFLSARITPLAGDISYARGIVLIGQKPQNTEEPPSIAMDVTQNQYRIVERRRDGSFVVLKDWGVSDSIVRDKENTLSLVLTADYRVLAFINGEYQNTVTPEGLYPDAMGVKITGTQTMAVDDFFSAEF